MANATTQSARLRAKTRPENAKTSAPSRAHDGVTSLVRLLAILDLFTPAAPAWSTNALIRAVGMSRSTSYRYIKAMTDVELLAPVSNGHYILGPRILELDLQIRQCDPLYNAAGAVMKRLVQVTGYSSLLYALFSSSVQCVREELTANSPPHLFGRGQRRPLFRGAASKIILPYLRPHQLKSLYAKHAKTIATSGLGSDWASFRANLAKIRHAGFVTTVGEINPGVVGVSAPIFNRSGQILGSIGIAGLESQFDRAEIERVSVLVRQTAAEMSERIGVISVGTDRPARAVG